MEISFNYVATFVSLIYGLSMAHALTCIAEYLQNYKQIKHYWVWWVWVIFLLLLSNGFWISLYHIWHDLESWKVAYIVFITFESCLFYLMYYIFFNHLKDMKNNNLREDYYKNKTLFFSLLVVALVCMLNISDIMIGKLSIYESFSKYPPYPALVAFILIFTRNHKVHAFLAVLLTALSLLDFLSN
jgi:hypothetical protein